MIGAIAGDIIGSVFEWNAVKYKNFPLFSKKSSFTDDSVLTIAIAKAVITDGCYLKAVKEIGRKYPGSGYGGNFMHWLFGDNTEPYNSWGNGSAMRVSPIGYAFDDLDAVLLESKKTAEITHNHPEGIKGAQATALAILFARQGYSKDHIKKEIETRFNYDLNRSVDSIRPSYSFDVSCQGSVPEAIISFLDSNSFEDTIRNAISLGGDSDTVACIAGGIAQAYYKIIPSEIINEVKQRLTPDLLEITNLFCEKYKIEF